MKTGSKIEKAILRYLEKKRSSVTFKELYEALGFSKQGYRNRVYLMIDKGIIERVEQKPSSGKKRTRSLFKLR